MKNAITASGPEPTSAVDARFGRAAYFMVYDTTTSTWTAVPNAQHVGAPQGAGARAAAGEESLAIVDAPPGTSCALIAAVRGCDYVLLVTEPTPFGLHDLRLTLAVVAALGLRAGVVVNREGLGDSKVEPLCAEAGVPILARIPFDRRIAEVYARGDSVADALPDVRSILSDLACAVLQESSCRNL